MRPSPLRPPSRRARGACRTGRVVVWGGFALVLVGRAAALPRAASASRCCRRWASRSSPACRYNMLLGQGGMLSFGHAVYTGLGTFVAVHALNSASATAALPIPVSLIPLVGGLAGMFFAVVLGYVTTKKAGTPFAMITLGIGELVFAMSLMVPGVLRRRGRRLGQPRRRQAGPGHHLRAADPGVLPARDLHASSAPRRCSPSRARRSAACSTRCATTPSGSSSSATARSGCATSSFIIAGFFAGIAGGMYALNFEIATAEVVGAARSGAYLLFTFLGGATFFFGPIIGARPDGRSASVLLSELTKAWLLYLGLIFLFMVMYAPGGIASLIMMNLRVAALSASCAGSGAAYAALAGDRRCVMLVGAAALIEMVYHLQLDAGAGSTLRFLGLTLDAQRADELARRARSSPLVGFGRVRVRAAPLRAASGARSRARSRHEIVRSDALSRRRRAREPGRHDAPYAVELKDLRKSFGKTEIIRGTDLAVAPGERVAIIGPNGAGKSTLFNLISGRFGPTQRRDPAQRQAHRRPEAVRDQPPRPGAQLPDHQHLRPPVGVREPALRRALVAGLPLRVLEVPGRPARRERPRRAADAR